MAEEKDEKKNADAVSDDVKDMPEGTEEAKEGTAEESAGTEEEKKASEKSGDEKAETRDKEDKDKKDKKSDEDGKSEKKKDKKEKKDKKDEKIAELTDRLQRLMAEFDNFRKRTEKEKSQMYDMGAGDVITKMLDIVDNFERGLKNADESDPFVEGMKKVYKQLTKTLDDLGVTAIEAEGKEFDPNLHNAVMHEGNPDVGENIITAELQKGYMYKGTVIRHSMVKVAN
jgi:molecular chaperone GrpE